MPLTFPDLNALIAHGYDDVIDVRSPAEFAADHVQGAINLPALSNEERAIVGTIYTQDSPFRARKIGAALVARNVAAHLDGPLHDREGGWRPLVYCWRGGQRSGSVAAILREVGWRAETIHGGYRSFRRLVQGALYETPLASPVILLDGFTGTAKTDILHQLPAHGVQSLDLEGLANHRGSLLGERPEGQPGQKGFETRLACAIAALDPACPVVIEAESSKIGRLNLPPALWQAMTSAPRITVDARIEDRARYLASVYQDMRHDRPLLARRLDPLRRVRGHAVVERWHTLLEQKDGPALARALIEDHYDPAYSRSRAAHEVTELARIDASPLDPPALEAAAAAVAEIVRAWPGR